jgi:general secretion pathway protein I
MWRGRRKREAGFTLVEVLVAIAILAISLAAIGSLMAMNVRGTRARDQRLALIETARAIETGLPPRGELVIGSSRGERAGHLWRVDVQPYPVPAVDTPVQPAWVPARVVIRVQSPGGALLQVETIRLVRRAGG